jgi:hypothetical protein
MMTANPSIVKSFKERLSLLMFVHLLRCYLDLMSMLSSIRQLERVMSSLRVEILARILVK